jgi:hypothetical protein
MTDISRLPLVFTDEQKRIIKTMAYKQIKFEAVAHYLRMMFWAYHIGNDDLYYYMRSEIDEFWNSRDCSYCDYYSSNCNNCELHDIYPSTGCCSGLWHAMDAHFDNRIEWLMNAHKVLKYIIDNG